MAQSFRDELSQGAGSDADATAERAVSSARAVPFRELLAAVVKHPAMLVWLDADSNRAGHPNENLARELLELFTLGIGNYAEADVQAAARALTGWTVGGKTFRFASQRHDDGELELLGSRRRMDGDELLAALVEQPATARRLAWRLATMFFGEAAIDHAALDELAAGLREHDLSVAWAVETILRSKLFFAEANLRSRVLGPVEFVVGTLHALDLCQPPPSTLLLAEWVTRMGQELFAPPNVGGWPEGRYVAWFARYRGAVELCFRTGCRLSLELRQCSLIFGGSCSLNELTGISRRRY